jgi:putative chitinase
MTPEQLIKISPYTKYKAVLYAPLITAAMQEFDINTEIRQSAFIAQILHESGSLRYVQELASGEDYEGRKSLGNTQAGDGKRFKG